MFYEFEEAAQDYVSDWDKADPGWRHHMPDSLVPYRSVARALEDSDADSTAEVVEIADPILLEAIAGWDDQAAKMRKAVCSGCYKYKDVTVLPNKGLVDVTDPRSADRLAEWPKNPDWTLTLSTPDAPWPPEAGVIRQQDADSWQEALALIYDAQDAYEGRQEAMKIAKQLAWEHVSRQRSANGAALEKTLQEGIDQQAKLWDYCYDDGHGKARALEEAMDLLKTLSERVKRQYDRLDA